MSKWWLLQKNKCPKCEHSLFKNKGTLGKRNGMTINRKCTNENCDFVIGIDKFSVIVGDIRQAQIKKGRNL